ncbi:MAG: hypothetical protein WBE83_09530 [Candidatus Cybelea sp.]
MNLDKALSDRHTFKYTGSAQIFKVSAGVTSLDIVALGAAGAGEARSGYYSAFGRGGLVHAIVSASPGEKLYVYVGGAGSPDIGGLN